MYPQSSNTEACRDRAPRAARVRRCQASGVRELNMLWEETRPLHMPFICWVVPLRKRFNNLPSTGVLATKLTITSDFGDVGARGTCIHPDTSRASCSEAGPLGGTALPRLLSIRLGRPRSGVGARYCNCTVEERTPRAGTPPSPPSPRPWRSERRRPPPPRAASPPLPWAAAAPAPVRGPPPRPSARGARSAVDDAVGSL